MADYHYVRWFPADYARDTQFFTQAQHGAYHLLLNAYYMAGGPLPDDDKILARITLSDTLSDWTATRSVLSKHFSIYDGLWHHKRCDEEIAYARATRESRVRGADKTNAQRHAQRHAQRDVSDTQPESESDDDDSENHADAQRHAQRLAVKHVADCELEDRQWEVTQAIALCIQNGFSEGQAWAAVGKAKSSGRTISAFPQYVLSTCRHMAEDHKSGNGSAPKQPVYRVSGINTAAERRALRGEA